MTRIALVVSDVDGTLLTKDKILTDGAQARGAAAATTAGIGFTITSSRPTIGMRFLIEPLRITLPIGPFNGSSIVDPQLKPIEQHLIPAVRGATQPRCAEPNSASISGCSPTTNGSPRNGRRRIRPARKAHHPGRSDHR